MVPGSSILGPSQPILPEGKRVLLRVLLALRVLLDVSWNRPPIGESIVFEAVLCSSEVERVA
jgi:hypothetical protein